MSGPTSELLAVHRRRGIRVTVDLSTHRWLVVFAKANGVTAGELLAQAAFCIAEHAGRRPGSWEASVAGQLCDSCGFQASIPFSKLMRVADQDECDLAAWRATLQAPGQGARS